MIELLVLPFQLPFMQQAMAIALLVALPMGLLSPFLVLKGWSLMGDAISHAVLPGIVLAYVVGLPLAVGAFAAGLVCALAVGYLKENSRVKEDTVMGVVFSGMFGLGIVMFSMIESELHLTHILFGDMLGVVWRDVAETGLIALLSLGFVGLLRRDLLLAAFDAQHARAIGLPVRFLHYGLLGILSLTIVGALKAVGIILAIAMLIAPGAIAFLLTRRFEAMLALSVAIAATSAVMGVYLAFFIDSAPAPTIVVLMTTLFIGAFAWSRLKAARARRDPSDSLPAL
ncbi:metal ABC transporter permease [Mesorhizobium sp. CAU 1741]|uniref:metal ABC transporter permease n=1 Tax=Mesorhizobium sp. CAU 1741 TaxID=3140366 RepID=UPI00325A5470